MSATVVTKESVAKMQELYDGGMMLKDIASIMGVSAPTVSRWIKKKQKTNFTIRNNQIITLFKTGVSISDIAKELRVTIRVVKGVLRDGQVMDTKSSMSRRGWVTNHPYAMELHEEERERYIEVVRARKELDPAAGYDYGQRPGNTST